MPTTHMDFLSSKSYFIALSVIFSIFLIRTIYQRLQGNKRKKKNYPPVGGSIFGQLLNFERLHDYMTDISVKHNTFRLFSPFRNQIYTTDPVLVEYILKTNFENYGKGRFNHSVLKDLLGDGIFAVDGEKWRQQRKVASLEFSGKVLRDFSSVIFQKNAAKLANVVSKTAGCNKTIDIQDLFMKSTLDSIFKIAFGFELDSLCGSEEEGRKFSRAFDEANALTLLRYMDILWKIKKFLNIGSEAALKKTIKVIDDFMYKLIHSKIEQMQDPTEDTSSMKKEDVLSRFLQLGNSDLRYLRDIILNFVIAGKDTTAGTLSWFIYLLCKHPEVQEKVAEEVKKATDSKGITNLEDFASTLTEETLERMRYLHAALTEALRLYPAVPLDAKNCFSDDTLPNGFDVNKGDLVSYQPYCMGRMKYIWGDDAEEFKPGRWLDGDGKFRPESPFKFTAFQAGPRICLGKEFAYRQMKIFSAVLLRFFIFKLSSDEETVKYKTMLTLHIEGGLHVHVFPRSWG